MIEAVRKIISLFKLYDTNENIWVADKTELYKVIDGVFNHLEWTVMLLDFIHGNSKDIVNYMTKGSSKFGVWFYTDAKNKYSNFDLLQEIEEKDNIVHEKANLIVRLIEANKNHEAMIEFSEVIEASRVIVGNLWQLKRIIIQSWQFPGSSPVIEKTPVIEQEQEQEQELLFESVSTTVSEKKDSNIVEVNLDSFDIVEDLEEI